MKKATGRMNEADFIVLKDALGVSWEALARLLHISSRNLRRYRRGELEVPELVQLAAEGLICRRLHQGRPVHALSQDDPITFKRRVRRFTLPK